MSSDLTREEFQHLAARVDVVEREVEGVAEDGTIEAIRVADAPGFALGVQWHAEYDPQKNPVNRKLFEAFGQALQAHSRD